MNVTILDILTPMNNYNVMPTKKATDKTMPFVASKGRRTKKRTGMIVQSLRMPVADNKLIRRAAQISRMSINGWGVKAIVEAAEKVIARKAIVESAEKGIAKKEGK